MNLILFVTYNPTHSYSEKCIFVKIGRVRRLYALNGWDLLCLAPLVIIIIIIIIIILEPTMHCQCYNFIKDFSFCAYIAVSESKEPGPSHQVVNILANTTEWTVGGLQHESRYRFSLCAHTHVGEGSAAIQEGSANRGATHSSHVSKKIK